MDYWHIQMHLPAGREGKVEIDSRKMLQEPKPVIGTGEWDDLQCYHFKGEQNGLNVGSIVMVRKGYEPLALVRVTSDWFEDEDLENKYVNRLYRYVEVLGWNANGQINRLFSQGTLKRLRKSSETESWKYIDSWYKKLNGMVFINNVVVLLKFKKQLIFQGPPGTGKTRLAKELAKTLTRPQVITADDVKRVVKPGQIVKSVADGKPYKVASVNDTGVSLQLENGNVQVRNYNHIIQAYTNHIQGLPLVGGDAYQAAVAKYIFENWEAEAQAKIIQFHPAYSYEDFVRGITTKTVGTVVEYVTKNKVLGEFAKAAQQNFVNSRKTTEALSQEQWFDKEFADFTDMVEDEIMRNGKYVLNETVSIVTVEEDAFRYGGDNWAQRSKLLMKYTDLKREYLSGVQTRQDIKKLSGISGRARNDASYDFMMLEKLKAFFAARPPYRQDSTAKEELRNYVLIIDEINRANLPAVFGELIYALEYRGQSVNSLYDIDGDASLVLPPNLFIIGTMNTADRSVGHIDYALRRRFAFKAVLPNPEPVHASAKLLFQKVSELFVKDYNTINWSAEHPKLESSLHLAPDFKPEEVWIGHSYFIAQDTAEHTAIEQLNLKRTFELLPLLHEYRKDGILLESAEGEIEAIKTLSIA